MYDYVFFTYERKIVIVMVILRCKEKALYYGDMNVIVYR